MSVNGNFFLDLASQCAVLSNFSNPDTLVQLSSSGNAILAIPSEYVFDGKLFVVKIGAILNIESGYNSFGAFSFGTAAGYDNSNYINKYSVNPGGSAAVLNLSVVANGYWNSTTQVLDGFSSLIIPGYETPALTEFSFSCSDTADIQFNISAGTGDGNPNTCSLTLTQFSISF